MRYTAKIADHGSQQASSHNGNWNQSKPLIRAPRFSNELYLFELHGVRSFMKTCFSVLE